MTRWLCGADWGNGPSSSVAVLGRINEQGKLEVVETMSHTYEERQEIERMFDDCCSVKNIAKDQGGPGYDKRSQDFLDSAYEQWTEKGWLSDKQLSWLKDLHERI